MIKHIDECYFRTLFSEFDKVPEPTLCAYIEIASMRVAKHVWCENTKYATALLTAHMMTARGFQGLGGTAGMVTQESVGDLSRAYQGVALEAGSGDAALMTTRYGIDYVALRNETIEPAMTTVGFSPRIPFRHRSF